MSKKKKPAGDTLKECQRATETTVDTTTQIRNRALEWISQNPDLWTKFKGYATNEAKHKRRISVQWLLEDSRKHDYVNRNGEPCKVNNSYSPVFARELLKECPEVRPYLEVRRSRFDGHDNG